MHVAYERVSTSGQSTLRQDVMMQEQQIEKVFTEKISGKDRNRKVSFKSSGARKPGRKTRFFCAPITRGLKTAGARDIKE